MRFVRPLFALALLSTVASAQVINSNTTWSGTVTVDRDVVVNPGVTLTVNAGTTINIATSDAANLGANTSRVELIVQGTLTVNGTSGSPVVFTSTGSAANSWVGIRVDAGGAATITSATIEEATQAIDATGNATLTGSTLKTNSYGVRVNGGTTQITGSFFQSNTYGIYGVAGSVTADHSTFVTNTYGVYSSGTSGAMTVNNSVLTDNQTGLYRYNTVNITNTFNDVWNNSSSNYSSTTPGTGSISSNPLYATGTYRLTSNSPARNSDSAAADMGAFPYTSDATTGLTGVLWSNTTLNTSQTISGDLTVPAGVTLTLAPGVTLTAASSDLMQANADTSRVELIVKGTLSVSAAANPVLLTASGTTAGSWTGVRVEAGGAANLNGVTIERASYALDLTGNATVSNATLRTNSYGARVNAGTSSFATTFFNANTYGIYGIAGSVTADHSTFVGNTYGAYSSGTSGAMTVNNSVLTGNQTGLYRYNTVNITNTFNDVWGNSSSNYSSTTPGTGSISSNPLYVTSGATPYRLTSNSPARNSDSAAGDMGAFPYTSDATSGLTGTLWTNTTLSSATITGDLIIPAGVTVTVPANVTLQAASSDFMQANADTSRVEIIVRGTLQLTGTSSMNAVLSASGTTAGSWTGVRVETGGTFNATGAIIERATYAIDATGDATVSGTTFRTNSYGVRVNAGTTTINTSFFNANTYGIYGVAGSVTADHSTFVGNTYGAYSSGTSGAMTVNNSVLTGNQTGLYRYNTVNITNTFNDVWGNTSSNYSSTTPGTGSISSNPLYVTSGATPYRLTSNSPARNSDVAAADMGAFPYTGDATSGLTGVLWTNTTLNSSQTITGDLTVPSGVTLTVAPGVTLQAASSDFMQANADTSRVELIVRGTLSVSAAGNPVNLSATGTTAGSWTGVRVETGGAVSLNGVIIERATYGLDLTGSATVNNATFRTNSYGARVNAGTSNFGTTFFNANTYGIYGVAGSVTADHSTFVGNTYGAYSSGTTGAMTVNNSILTGNQTGLYRYNTVNITNTYNDVWGNTSSNYSSTTPGLGSISSNPLYVTTGMTPYRITANSPARRSDSTGGDMGAFPYLGDATTGLTGTLWVDTTINTSQSLAGDLVVPVGVTLTIAPGVTLTAAGSDQMQAGNDTSRIELIVLGTLVVNAASNPVTLTSSGTTAGSWTGVRVEASGSAQLTGVSVRTATYGVDAFGNVTLGDCALGTNSYGLRVSSGSTTVARCLFNANTYGVYGIAGSVNVDHSTFVGNTYGLYSSGTSGAMGVTNSVLTGNQTGLYRYNTVNIGNSNNDVWGNTSSNYSSTTPGANSISSNPLYVGTGSTPYRLTSNSPARKSDSTGGDMGAFPFIADPTVGLTGVLWQDTTLSASAAVLGDLTVPTGVTVTIAPGVTLTAAASDQMQSGTDTSRIELMVRGTLQVSGTGAMPVTLTSSGVSAGSWTGIIVPAGGNAVLNSALVQRGSVCLDLAGASTVVGSRFNTCSTGIRSTGGTHAISFTVFDSDTYGYYGNGGADTLDHLTAYGNTYGVYSAGTTGSIAVTNSIFSTNTNGLYRYNTVNITNSYNDFFNSPLSSTTQGTNTITVDPLLISPSTADYHLQAASPARGVGTSSSDLGAFPFAPGPVDRVVITPTAVTIGAGSTVTFTASAFDVANNPVPTATFSWSALAAAGVINQSGVLTASCTPGSVTGGVTVSSNGKTASANVSITIGAVASLVVSPSSVNVKSQQTQQFSVMALDACSNPVSSPSISWSALGSVGIIDPTGLYTAGCARGSYPMSIVATAGSITGRASVTVDPGVLSTVSVSPTTASIPVNGTRQFTGGAADGCGNPLSATPITWTTNVTGANINTSGLLTVGTTPGTFTGGVTATATENTTTRTARADISVTGGAVATVMVMPGNATLTAGQTANFSAVALDSFGNMVAGTPTWTVVSGGGVINSSGMFTAGTTAGTFANTVRATIAGVNGTASVTINPGPVTRVSVSPTTATLAPGGTTTFTAQAFDSNNNLVTAPVTWAAMSTAGTITAGGVFTAGTMSGNYPASITATVNGVNGTASVTINAGALAQLTVMPSVSTTQAGGTLAFTASGRDGNNNTVAVTPTWTVVAGGGAISTMGVFTAGTTTGTFTNTVRAEQNGVTAFATVSVTAGPLVRVDVTPAAVDLQAGQTQQFSATGSDAFGNPVGVSLTWNANAMAGTVTQSGLFTAGQIMGDYADGVSATAMGVTGVATIRVHVPMMMDAGMDAGTDAGVEVDAGTDAGMMMMADGGMMMVETDAGMTMQAPDAGMPGDTHGVSTCSCSNTNALLGALGLLVMSLRRRRALRVK
ncbi:MAG: NosD domain-containing protein [Archangium sp.]